MVFKVKHFNAINDCLHKLFSKLDFTISFASNNHTFQNSSLEFSSISTFTQVFFSLCVSSSAVRRHRSYQRFRWRVQRLSLKKPWLMGTQPCREIKGQDCSCPLLASTIKWVFKLNFYAIESLMLHFPWCTAGRRVWNLKGAHIVSPLQQVTHTIYHRYLRQIKFTHLSLLFIHAVTPLTSLQGTNKYLPFHTTDSQRMLGLPRRTFQCLK